MLEQEKDTQKPDSIFQNEGEDVLLICHSSGVLLPVYHGLSVMF